MRWGNWYGKNLKMKVVCQIHIETNADPQHRKNAPYIRRDPRFIALSSYLAPPQLFRQLAKTDFAVFLLRYRYVESKKNKRQEDAVLIAGWEGVEAI
jgi:hypothetical protein